MPRNQKLLLSFALVFVGLGSVSFARETSVNFSITGEPFHLTTPSIKEIQAVPKRIAFVGNSYMYFNCGVDGFVRVFAKGKSLQTKLFAISGAGLAEHPVESYFLAGNKAKEKFDVILFQGPTRKPWEDGKSEKKTPRRSYAVALKNAVEVTKKSGATPAVVATWAPAKVQIGSRGKRAADLMNATVALANENQILAIPVGLAFEVVRSERSDILLNDAGDFRHPTTAGSFLFGAVIYASLFKEKPSTEGIEGFTYGCGAQLNPRVARYLEDVAWRVVTQFFSKGK